MDREELDLIAVLDFSRGLWSAGQPRTTLTVSVRWSPKLTMDSFHVLQPQPKTDSFDVALIMDATGSMGPFIGAARDSILGIANDLQANYPGQSSRFAVVAYRDLDPSKPNVTKYPVEVLPFTDDVNQVRTFLSGLAPTGGHDIPEDVFSGFDTVESCIHTRIPIEIRTSRSLALDPTVLPHPPVHSHFHFHSHSYSHFQLLHIDAGSSIGLVGNHEDGNPHS